MKKQLLTLSLALAATLAVNAGNDSTEDRKLWGSIAVAPGSDAINHGDYTSANNKVLLTWRMLPGDDGTEEFNLWRKMGTGNWSCVNDAFKTGNKGIKATNYQHSPMSTITGDIYYRLTYNDGQKSPDNYIGEYVMKKEQAEAKVPYIEIPLLATDDCSDYPNTIKY